MKGEGIIAVETFASRSFAMSLPIAYLSQGRQYLHNTDFQVSYLDFDPEQNLIACTKAYKTGSINLVTMNPDAVRPQNITEGDSVDLAPGGLATKRWCINPQVLAATIKATLRIGHLF